jgi:hypothetical protein
MLSLMEHMYHELGLVAEFNINPITLKRWIVSMTCNKYLIYTVFHTSNGRRGRDHVVVGFTTTYAISAYQH